MVLSEIPVVLVVAGKKVDNVTFVIQALFKKCGFEKFYLICPERDIQRASQLASKINLSIEVISENLIIPGLSHKVVANRLQVSLPDWPEYHLPGWYFQQFLKIGFSLYAKKYKYYLIWDADTIPLRSLTFFEDEVILITQGNEYHKHYFKTISLLFSNLNLQSISHISQHLMVNTFDMNCMIHDLEKAGQIWWCKILESLTNKYPFQQFSEYETYATFCLSNRPHLYKSIKRSWFRYGKSYFNKELSDSRVGDLGKYYDYIAFEEWDVGFLRTLRSYFMVKIKKFKHFANIFV
jgi:hypothetical protein